MSNLAVVYSNITAWGSHANASLARNSVRAEESKFCDLTSSRRRPPPPLRQGPRATPSKGADFESIFGRFWPKVAENGRKRGQTAKNRPRSRLLRAGFCQKGGGGVCGCMVKSQSKFIHHELNLSKKTPRKNTQRIGNSIPPPPKVLQERRHTKNVKPLGSFPSLVTPYRAILRYYRCDTPYRAIVFQGD